MSNNMTLLLLLLLAGCAGPSVSTFQDADPAYRQCEYEATMATQTGASPLVLGYRRAELLQQCLRAKGRS